MQCNAKPRNEKLRNAKLSKAIVYGTELCKTMPSEALQKQCDTKLRKAAQCNAQLCDAKLSLVKLSEAKLS
jgi:uncharacterized protein YjbI with pentapeptide repeats